MSFFRNDYCFQVNESFSNLNVLDFDRFDDIKKKKQIASCKKKRLRNSDSFVDLVSNSHKHVKF